MNEIQVSAATTTKDQDAFSREISKSISRVANLAGWPKRSREEMLDSIDAHPAVLRVWRELQRKASLLGPIGIWEWNTHVRVVVDHLLRVFYQEADGEG